MEAQQRDISYKICTKCNRKFKRLEHLHRHERVHDDKVRFACTQCPKVFTRSDILKRHEAAHAAAAAQSNDGNAATKRACFECAKARERCSKGEPCQRCNLRDLSCSYPKGRSHLGKSESPLSLDRVTTSYSSTFAQRPSPGTPTPEDGATTAISEECPEYTMGPLDMEIDNHRDASERLLEPTGIANVDSMVDIASRTPIEFSLNWLPMDESISIDYESILGMDINSLGLFPNQILPDGIQNPGTANAISGYHSVPDFPLASHGPMRGINRILQISSPSRAWETTPSQTASSSMSCTSSGSTTRTIASAATSAGLYATSTNGARLPCTTWRRQSMHEIPTATPMKSVVDPDCRLYSNNVSMGFPRTDHINIDTIPTLASYPRLNGEMYDQMCKQHRRLCLQVDNIFSLLPFGTFPSQAAINFFIHLYFENFDTVIPILHAQVTNLNEHWLLALAVSAIGCQYAYSEEFSACAVPLHEMLRRAIIVELEKSESSKSAQLERDEVALIQARILNHFGMVYFGSADLAKRAKTQHGVLVELALSSNLLSPSLPIECSPRFASAESQNLDWRLAIIAECKRRCGYAIWLLDCMSVYHFSQRPLMPPAVTQCRLPEDALWAIKSPKDWTEFSGRHRSDVPSLSTAVMQIFTKKHMSTGLDQFSCILLLHGVYREIFQLKDCFARPLSGWVPSMQLVTNPTNGPKNESAPDTTWRSLLSSWRNASLDCVDVLHWAANGTIAQHAGVEHPTVLHLHLARTILLAPFEEIQLLSASIAASAQEADVENPKIPCVQATLDAERAVLNWAQRDQYKARLAVLHCGCLFWHMRRYSCRAFYEPISVYLATLTLWAYSSYTSRTTVTKHQFGADSDDDPTEPTSPTSNNQPIPTFIHLDRPNDDEMVQYFVLSGTPSTMRANITGVGDMYGPKGPIRILKEGRKILASVSMAWGRTKEYVDVLESLERATSK